LLSKNVVNEIIAQPFPLEEDEELLGHYISLLKMLSMRFNVDTVFLFKNEVPRLLRARGGRLVGATSPAAGVRPASCRFPPFHPSRSPPG
jgi:hypothetical protein